MQQISQLYMGSIYFHIFTIWRYDMIMKHQLVEFHHSSTEAVYILEKRYENQRDSG